MSIDAYVCPLCAMTVPRESEGSHEAEHMSQHQGSNEVEAEALDNGHERE